ncbi:MAG: glycogen-binding domain-containing protein, partial [Bacteroidetes bacterium]|nr:glycogen-binding domain-containing protein [Bacteroidota bacterium]
SVIGDFNGWQPDRTPLRRARGAWSVDVPLPPGEYQYKFWVDGVLIRDKLSSSIIADGEGGYNAVLMIR